MTVRLLSDLFSVAPFLPSHSPVLRLGGAFSLPNGDCLPLSDLVLVKTFRAASFVILSAACCIAASEGRAQLRNQMPESEKVWKTMDECKRQAWKEHPDYTPKAKDERDHAMKLCLQAHGSAPPVSPPREGTGSSQPLR